MEHTQASPEEYWIMRAKTTANWKLWLEGQWHKGYVLDFVERAGDTIRVRVQSGKEVEFTIGQCQIDVLPGQYNHRGFKIKSTSGPARKISFNESLWQMDREWWTELSNKLGATTPAWAKVLVAATKILKAADDM